MGKYGILLIFLASCGDASLPPYVAMSAPDAALPDNACAYAELLTNGELGFPGVVYNKDDVDTVNPGIQLDIWARFLKVDGPVWFWTGREHTETVKIGNWFYARVTLEQSSGTALLLLKSQTGCPNAIVLMDVKP
jgi:hypothetical protein